MSAIETDVRAILYGQAFKFAVSNEISDTPVPLEEYLNFLSSHGTNPHILQMVRLLCDPKRTEFSLTADEINQIFQYS